MRLACLLGGVRQGGCFPSEFFASHHAMTLSRMYVSTRPQGRRRDIRDIHVWDDERAVRTSRVRAVARRLCLWCAASSWWMRSILMEDALVFATRVCYSLERSHTNTMPFATVFPQRSSPEAGPFASAPVRTASECACHSEHVPVVVPLRSAPFHVSADFASLLPPASASKHIFFNCVCTAVYRKPSTNSSSTCRFPRKKSTPKEDSAFVSILS